VFRKESGYRLLFLVRPGLREGLLFLTVGTGRDFWTLEASFEDVRRGFLEGGRFFGLVRLLLVGLRPPWEAKSV